MIKEFGHRALIECHAFQTMLMHCPAAQREFLSHSAIWVWGMREGWAFKD